MENTYAHLSFNVPHIYIEKKRREIESSGSYIYYCSEAVFTPSEYLKYCIVYLAIQGKTNSLGLIHRK